MLGSLFFRLLYGAGLLAVSLQLLLWLTWESILLALTAVVVLLVVARRLRETPTGNRILGLSRRQRYTGRPPRELESPLRWLAGKPRADAVGPLAEVGRDATLIVDDEGRRRVVWSDGRVVTLDDPPQPNP